MFTDEIERILLQAKRLEDNGDFISAANKYEEFLKESDSFITIKEKSIYMGVIATCHWKAGDLDKALEVYEDVKKFREQIEDRSSYGMTLMNMGEIYGGKSNYEKGLALILEGLCITLKESDSFQKIIGYIQLIELLVCTGQIRKAIKANLELLELLSIEGDYNRYFEELLRISKHARMINAFELSEDLCSEAMNLAKKVNNPSYQNKILFELAKVEKEKKNFNNSLKKYEEIIANAKKMNDHHIIEEVLYEHALLLEEMGNFPMAIVKLGECEQYTQHTGNMRLAQHCKDLQARWMFGKLMKGGKDDLFGKKKGQEDSSPEVEKQGNKFIINTRFYEGIPLFAHIDHCQMSYDNALALFSPIDHSTKVWDLHHAKKLIDDDEKLGGNFISSWATFAPGTHKVIIAYYQRNLWKNANFVNVVRFYPVRTIDNEFKIANWAGFKLNCKDPETFLGFITESGRRVFTFSESQGLEAWDTESGEILPIANPQHYSNAKLITSDLNGDKIFCYRNGKLEITTYSDLSILHQFTPHIPAFRSLSIALDLSKVAYETENGDFELWDIETQSQLGMFPISEGSKKNQEKTIYHSTFYINERYAFNSDGTMFSFYGLDGKLYVCDINKNKVITQLPSPVKSVSCMNFSPDSSKLMVSTYRQESYIYELSQLKEGD